MSTIKFLNHSSFLLESEKNFFLCDPWYEGTAFFDGWNLVSNDVSNDFVNKILDEKKKINVWYSHEHSDHFSINFLKSINLKKNIEFFYKKSADKRVVSFLQKNFKVNEVSTGKDILIDQNISFKIFPYKNTDDSFCLIKFFDKYILNLNDCVVKTVDDCKYIEKLIKIKNINFIFAQFSYATWRNLKVERESMALNKIKRLDIILNYFNPDFLFPFASFIYFSHKENQFMNDSINTPRDIYYSPLLKKFRKKIIFLKPLDIIDIEKIDYKILENLNHNSINYWDDKYKLIQNNNINTGKKFYDFESLKKTFYEYNKIIKENFFLLPNFLEKIKFIEPIIIFVKDLNKNIKISYLGEFSVSDESYDIECSSEALFSILRYEYGWDGIKISGRFKSNKTNGYNKINRFFSLQSRFRNGQTFFNLKELIKYASYASLKKIS